MHLFSIARLTLIICLCWYMRSNRFRSLRSRAPPMNPSRKVVGWLAPISKDFAGGAYIAAFCDVCDCDGSHTWHDEAVKKSTASSRKAGLRRKEKQARTPSISLRAFAALPFDFAQGREPVERRLCERSSGWAPIFFTASIRHVRATRETRAHVFSSRLTSVYGIGHHSAPQTDTRNIQVSTGIEISNFRRSQGHGWNTFCRSSRTVEGSPRKRIFCCVTLDASRVLR